MTRQAIIVSHSFLWRSISFNALQGQARPTILKAGTFLVPFPGPLHSLGISPGIKLGQLSNFIFPISISVLVCVIVELFSQEVSLYTSLKRSWDLWPIKFTKATTLCSKWLQHTIHTYGVVINPAGPMNCNPIPAITRPQMIKYRGLFYRYVWGGEEMGGVRRTCVNVTPHPPCSIKCSSYQFIC